MTEHYIQCVNCLLIWKILFLWMQEKKPFQEKINPLDKGPTLQLEIKFL